MTNPAKNILLADNLTVKALVKLLWQRRLIFLTLCLIVPGIYVTYLIYFAPAYITFKRTYEIPEQAELTSLEAELSKKQRRYLEGFKDAKKFSISLPNGDFKIIIETELKHDIDTKQFDEDLLLKIVIPSYRNAYFVEALSEKLRLVWKVIKSEDMQTNLKKRILKLKDIQGRSASKASQKNSLAVINFINTNLPSPEVLEEQIRVLPLDQQINYFQSKLVDMELEQSSLSPLNSDQDLISLPAFLSLLIAQKIYSTDALHTFFDNPSQKWQPSFRNIFTKKFNELEHTYKQNQAVLEAASISSSPQIHPTSKRILLKFLGIASLGFFIFVASSLLTQRQERPNKARGRS